MVFSKDLDISALYCNSDLIDDIEFDDDEDFSYDTRTEALESILPDRASIDYVRRGQSKGELFITVVLDDSVWMMFDFYGSCVGIDSYMGYNEHWIKRALRDMYEFESYINAVTWILFKYYDSTDDLSLSIVEAAIEKTREEFDKVDSDLVYEFEKVAFVD